MCVWRTSFIETLGGPESLLLSAHHIGKRERKLKLPVNKKFFPLNLVNCIIDIMIQMELSFSKFSKKMFQRNQSFQQNLSIICSFFCSKCRIVSVGF